MTTFFFLKYILNWSCWDDWLCETFSREFFKLASFRRTKKYR